MRIAIDAMGGDHAPGQIVRGAVESVSLLDGGHILLVGDEPAIRAEMDRWARAEDQKDRVSIRHTTQVVGMDESPLEAVRQKRDSSLVRAAQLAAGREVDAVISAGNTGAFAAACQLKIRPLPGVARPGIAVVIPTFYGPIVVCDVGANITPKPHHLYQYGIMAAIYAEEMVGIREPRVALLSVGEEDVKGTGLIKQANELIRSKGGVRFVGNIEGQDIWRGVTDVVVCDGFVGNIVLKLTEGLAEGIIKTITREVEEEDPSLVAAFRPALERVWEKHDYSEYGGAPLLGVDSVCVICHGRSDHRAIRNAIRFAGSIVARGINEAFCKRLERD